MENNLLLKDFITNKQELFAVYSNPLHSNWFNVGKLLAHEGDELILSVYDEEGRYDGFCLYDLQHVFRIEKCSEYLNCLLKKIQKPLENISFNTNLWEDYWRKTSNRLVKIRYKDSMSIFGIPICCSESFVKLLRIYRNGKEGRMYQIRKSDFIMSCCGLNEKELYENYLKVSQK